MNKITEEQLFLKQEKKTSFQLYNRHRNAFKDLTDAEAGKLIKHIFDYVDDLKPEPLKPRLLHLLFLSIKADLKKDLSKWLNKCNTNKINGAKGGRPRR